MPRCCLVLFLWISLSASAQFNVTGSASVLGNDCVQLTPAANSQQGSAWNVNQVDVSLPFCIQLSVNLGSNNSGADGMAFVLQQLGPNAPSTGNGGNLGYGNYTAGTLVAPTFTPSLIVEFDTYFNGGQGDPNEDHIALQRDGTQNHTGPECLAGPIAASSTSNNIEDGQDHTVLITWNPETQIYRCEFDGVERFEVNVDMVGDVFAGNSLVWWGFTGSTGGLNNAHSFCLLDLSNSQGIPDLSLTPAPPSALCEGDEITLDAASPGLQLDWDGSGSTTLTAGPGVHTVQTVSQGCPLSEVITIAPLPTPDLLTEPDITLCDGAPTVLTAEAADGTVLDWDGTGQATLPVNGAGIHTVVGTLGSCAESLEVTVIDQASPVVSVSPGPSIDVCEGETVTVQATTDVASTITWTANGAAQPGTTYDVVAEGLVQASAEAGGCPGNTVTLNIDVLPLPTAVVSAIPETLCFGETGLVSAVPNAGSTVTSWELPAGTPAPNQAGPGLYTAQLEGANGCTSTASIALNQLPPIEWTLDAPLGECSNTPTALTVAGNHETATWSTGATGDLLELTAADGPGPFEVTVSLGGCTESAQTTVEWWPVPVIGPLPDTVVHCVLDQPEVWTWPAQADAPIGWWAWTVNEDVVPGGPAWDTEGDYFIRIFDSMTGCEDTASLVVDVWPNLDVAAAPMQGVVCWGEETEVIAELRAVEGTNLDEIPYTLEWSDPSIEGLNPSVPAGTYLLTAENACGIDVTTVEVAQEYCGCDMWVPTAFTPDNDGINDGFKVESNCTELDDFRFQVFDRWGERVWETADPDQAWMGQAAAGQAMEGQHFIPDGVYGYRLFWKYSETGIPVIEERRGHIHILR